MLRCVWISRPRFIIFPETANFELIECGFPFFFFLLLLIVDYLSLDGTLMSPLEQGREEERSRKTLFKLLLHSLGSGTLWARQGPGHTSGAGSCKISAHRATQHEPWGNFSQGKQPVKASEVGINRSHTGFPFFHSESSHLFVQACWVPMVNLERTSVP